MIDKTPRIKEWDLLFRAKARILLIIAIPVLLLMGDFGTAIQADNGDEDSFGVFIKGFEFVRPYQPPDSEETIALKERRRQIQEMVNAEKERLGNAPELTSKNISAHIAFLEDSLHQVDKEITKEGDTLVPNSELQELTADYRGRELTLEEMNDVADLVTMAYQDKGYILAEAYLTEQEIEDGILKIAVSEGDVGEIRISGEGYYNERVIRRNFLQQLKHGVISEELLEKGLLLSKEVPSAETRIVLEAGDKEGTANIVLQTEDSLALDWSIDVNNFGSDLIGKQRYGTTIDITDPWWGSTLSLRGVSGNDPEDSMLVSGDLSIPFNMYGTRFELNYMEGLYVVGQELADLGLDGDTRIYGAGLSQPLLRQRNQSLTMSIGYQNKYARSYSQNELENVDDLDVFYASLDYDSLDRYLGKNLISFGYYWGSLNPDSELPYTRKNAEHRFRRYNLSLARIQKVYGNVNFMLRGAAQVSNQSLLPIEEMAIGGYGTVRGHDATLFLGDSGFTISGELLTAPPYIADKVIFGQRIAQMAQLAVFYDFGRVYYVDPQRGESNDERLKGYGAGVRLYYKDLFSFKFDLARPTKKKAVGEDSTYLYFMGSVNLASEDMLETLKKIGSWWGNEPDEDSPAQ